MTDLEIDELISNYKLLISNRKLIIKLIENKPIKEELKEEYKEYSKPFIQKYLDEIEKLEGMIKDLETKKKENR